MTSIAWDGGPIFRNGAVGTEQACCCQQPPCCISSTNCTITVTVTYSNGQTRTNGENQLDEAGNEIGGTPISTYITDCNTIGFSHTILSDGTCSQGAFKEQKINCTTCCTDPFGVGCNCSFGTVVSETYTFTPNDPGAECDQTPDINYVTSIAFTLTDCGDCPCEFP